MKNHDGIMNLEEQKIPQVLLDKHIGALLKSLVIFIVCLSAFKRCMYKLKDSEHAKLKNCICQQTYFASGKRNAFYNQKGP